MSDGAIETLVEHANRVKSPFTVVVIEAKGGAIPRVPEDSMALVGRGAQFAFYGIAQWEDPAEADEHIAWAREFGAAMEPYSANGHRPQLRDGRGQRAGAGRPSARRSTRGWWR